MNEFFLSRASFRRYLLSPHFLAVLGLALLAGPIRVYPQTQANLGIQLYAGVSITGSVGTVIYSVQYLTNLSQTNNWITLATLTLPSTPYLWVDTTVAVDTKWAGTNYPNQRYYRAVGASTPPIDMVVIPAGPFLMGDGIPDPLTSTERPQHQVFVSSFYMDKYLVTKPLWDEVNAWGVTNGYGYENLGSTKGGTNPVQSINWFDAVKWCNARSKKVGLRPCYYTNAALMDVYKTNRPLAGLYVDWAADGYRLPTEAEWEKAARGGLSGKRFPWGDNISHSDANYFSTNLFTYDISPTRGYHPTYKVGGVPYTSPVGVFAPNSYGLCDMAGNVDEWCWDWYDAAWYNKSGATENDTRGPTVPHPNGYRVARGGSWYGYATNAACAYRNYGPHDTVNSGVGFRCVRGH